MMKAQSQQKQTKQYKLIVVGEYGTGKSAMIRQFVEGKFENDRPPTIGGLPSKDVLIKDRSFRLQIWDTASQQKYASLSPIFYRNTRIALVVFSITQKASFDKIQWWIESVNKYGGGNSVIIMIGNKLDLVDQRQVTREQALEVAKKFDIQYIEISAKNAKSVEQCFMKSVIKMKDSMDNLLDKKDSYTQVEIETPLRKWRC